MKNYSLNELREMYLSFFESKGHLRMKSFPLVPQNDKSLLLINAGMAPLKPYFTGQETPPNKRVTTCQKCIRTGDIENVGKTARHGTFFEMLGNFSFGDYFKKEAISWAWEFVTQVVGIPEERLYVSVYEEDEEAAMIWHKEIGLPKEKIFYMGKEDNFWEVGTVGPCGPCSEIYFDRGKEFGCGKENCTVGCDCDRYLEFWNLVFTQFDKQEDGSYLPLPKPNIDTGMGLERIAAMMQGVHSIFDVDTVKAIRDHVCELAGVKYGEDAKKDISIRVITDHIRSVTFMASDGIRPSNEGRGYVMRRLLRRAVRHGKLLGIEGLFLKDLVKTVVDNSKHEYNELEEKYDYIIKTLTVEEEGFNRTIEQGLMILKDYVEALETTSQSVLDGASCFKLYDTYGFPIDLTREILEEKGFSIDEEGFKLEMEKQRERARNAQGETTYMGSEETVFHQIPTNFQSVFVRETGTLVDTLAYLTTENALVEKLEEAQTGYAITAQTPFYPEGGGQAGDCGVIVTATGQAEVLQTQKVVGGKIAHEVKVTKGYIEKNQKVTLTFNAQKRLDTARNHTATHLLQKALRDQIGTHVEQAGSNVNSERLRFDYTHFEPLTKSQLVAIEAEVNEKIMAGLPITICETSMEEARKMGAMALFGEKYGESVRVVNMGEYSVELCGGTHLVNTSQVGTFKILSETGVAGGVRRIEAVTGHGALHYYAQMEETLQELSKQLKANKLDVVKRTESLIQDNKNLQKENEKLKAQISRSEADTILQQVEKIKDVNILVAQLEGVGMNDLRQMGDTLKDKLGKSVVVLAARTEEKVNLVAMATNDAVQSGVHCGHIISRAVKLVAGGGGGRPNMAQAGGKDVTKIQEALQEARIVIDEQLC